VTDTACSCSRSGVGVPWVLEAQQLLREDWGIAADVWSVTSWTELRRDGLAADEHNFLHPLAEPRTAYLTEKLRDAAGPVLGVSDYMHAVQDQIREWVPRYVTLGADGFGFSDTRPPRVGSSRSTDRPSSSAPCRRWPTKGSSTGRCRHRRSRSTACTM
jgi:pyruvate dehydrogenase complex dehydrogenase (E1) component